MAVLLKTASVRVSFIQIIQVRLQNNGKTVWKSRYVGDVSQAKTTFVRVSCTTCPLSNPTVVGSLLVNIWEEDQGHYK